MILSDIIVGVCCVLAFEAVVWAAINEFRPDLKDDTNIDLENEDGEEDNHE